MEDFILADGRTRCRAAWETVNTDIQSFFQTHSIGSSVAVWTFAGAGATPLTTGFVDQATAIGVLAPLGNTPCDSSTPLADAACDTIDALVASFPAGPKETRELSISSDGLENNSNGPCSGPNSLAGTQCGACGAPDSFDCGSWQQLVCDHAIGNVVALVKLWGDDGQRFASGVMDSETGAFRSAGVPDAVFFQALADATGGTYTFIADNPPAPSGPPAFGFIGACCLFDGTCQDAITEAECAVLNGTHQGENSTCAGLALPCVSLIPTVSEWGLIAILLLVVVAGMLIFTKNVRAVQGWRRERFDGP